MSTVCVRVNEAAVFATDRGVDWWLAFSGHHPGRITRRVVSMAGDLVDVACDDREHADWLAGRMLAEGLPRSAVQVRCEPQR